MSCKFCLLPLLVAILHGAATAEEAKPRVAVFPLAGDAPAELREKVGFSLRAKFDRDGTYEAIDGEAMADAVGERQVKLYADVREVQAIGKELDAEVLVWGELTSGEGGPTLRVKLFDVLQLDPQPHEVTRQITKATDVRFVTEAIAEALPGVRKHAHPNEVAVRQDATAEQLWQANPNLVPDGSFDEAGTWEFVYLDQRSPVKHEPRLPVPDEAVVTSVDDNRVLAIRMSRTAAETNGLAVLSKSIPIEPNTRYRLSFRYKSDGPRLRVFVKGYTQAETIKGEPTQREIYRRQVPPADATNGQWVTVTDELNPQHVAMPVQTLKVDLYVYLHPGLVLFDDVTLKAVGQPTRDAKDSAIDKAMTRPTTQPVAR